MTTNNPNPSVPQPGPAAPANPYAQQPSGGGRKHTGVYVGIAALVVVLLVVVAVVAFQAGSASRPQVAATPAGPSQAAGAPGNPSQTVTVTADSIEIGAINAPVTVDIYLDYMCPYCGQFERANGAELQQDVAAGTVRLNLHIMNFLDHSSSTQYSSRAANAVVTLAKQAPNAVLAFHYALYEQQPAEGTVGLSDAQLGQMAVQAGAPQQVADSFAAHTNFTWVAASEQAAGAAGVTGTPTVKVNGTQFTGNLYQAGALTSTIANLAKS